MHYAMIHCQLHFGPASQTLNQHQTIIGSASGISMGDSGGIPANAGNRAIAGSILAQRLRRWPDIEPTMV